MLNCRYACGRSRIFVLELGVSTKGTNDHFAEFDVTSPTAHMCGAQRVTCIVVESTPLVRMNVRWPVID